MSYRGIINQLMQRRGRTKFILSFLAPAGMIYLVFVVWPLLNAIWTSFFRWRGVSRDAEYIGIDNYRELVADPVFLRAITNNFWLLIIGGAIVIALGVMLAHAMNASGSIARFLRGVYLFPQVISLVVVAILWTFLLNPSFGIVDPALRAIGIEPPKNGWLGNPNLALPAVGAAFVWYVAGFYIMLFSAGLKNIPEEIGEAAALDGAHGMRKFWTVTWPLLWSIKRVAAIYIVINVMNVFALVYLMTQGGPDRRSEVMLTYLYEQAFKNSKFGYATALAVVNFVIAMVLSMIVMAIYRRNPEVSRSR